MKKKPVTPAEAVSRIAAEGARVMVGGFMGVGSPHRLIDELAHQGVGIIVISSNISEILGICDRIMVLRQGRIVAELPREHATQSLLLAHAGGRGLAYG